MQFNIEISEVIWNISRVRKRENVINSKYIIAKHNNNLQ